MDPGSSCGAADQAGRRNGGGIRSNCFVLETLDCRDASLVQSQGEQHGGPSEVQIALVVSERATWREWLKIAKAEKDQKKILSLTENEEL